MTALELILVILPSVALFAYVLITRSMQRKAPQTDDVAQSQLADIIALNSEKTRLETEKSALLAQCEQQTVQLGQATQSLEGVREQLATARIEQAKAQDAITMLKEQAVQQQEVHQAAKTELADLNQKYHTLHLEKTTLETEYNILKDKQQEVKKEIENMQAQSKLQFEKIANEILEEKSTKFTETNRVNLRNLLEPLDKSIGEFRQNINDNLSKETEQRTRVEEQIKKVMEQTTLVSQQANNLASALKTNNKTMGNWGESILETILENSGLIKGQHYETQKGYIDEDNVRKIPDVIVTMPDKRKVVIDSKVSLVDYDRYFTVESDAEKLHCLKQHIASVRAHVDGLSKKSYDDIRQSLDFTMMFIPIESAYLLAMQNDPELWNYAYKKRILIISATTLISSLKIISDLWRKDKQNKSAEKIIVECESMYKKMLIFLDTFEKVGRNISTAKDSYDTAFNQLKQGKGNLIGKAQKLVELGIKTDRQLPPAYEEYDTDPIDEQNQ